MRDKAILSRCEGKKVLHLGAIGGETEGRDKYLLHKKIKSVADEIVGLDIKESDRADIVQKDVEDFDLGKTFEVLVAPDLIEHLENPGLFLDNCRKHMGEESELVITTPNIHSIYSLKRRLFHSQKVSENHTLAFTVELLRQFLKRKEFKLQVLETVMWESSSSRLRKFLSKLVPPPLQTTLFTVVEI